MIFKQPLGVWRRWNWSVLTPDLMPDSTNLVDPASSHMLVSKIKPCKSKYKLPLYGKTANSSLQQS